MWSHAIIIAFAVIAILGCIMMIPDWVFGWAPDEANDPANAGAKRGDGHA